MGSLEIVISPPVRSSRLSREAMLGKVVRVAVLLLVTSAVALRPNCFGFPDQPFSPANYAKGLPCKPLSPECLDHGLGVRTGSTAPDFVLQSLEGTTVHLAELLKTKPVFLQ